MTQRDSNTQTPGPADAVIGGMLGWLFVLVGAAAIGAATLIPGYFETLDIQEARAVEAAKAQMLAQERERYEQFHQALVDDDPVLIERLAITELRLKPVGTEIAQRGTADPLALVSRPSIEVIDAAAQQQPLMRSIENELSRPDLKQQATHEAQIDRPRQTRLVATALGEHRPWLAGAGALLVLLGLWPRRAAG